MTDPIDSWPVRSAYKMQKATAKRRRIKFALTLEEWWSIWRPHWDRRRELHLCMARHRDQGAYEIGNVRIATWQENQREAHALRSERIT